MGARIYVYAQVPTIWGVYLSLRPGVVAGFSDAGSGVLIESPAVSNRLSIWLRAEIRPVQGLRGVSIAEFGAYPVVGHAHK
jgi:hypothetical protein